MFLFTIYYFLLPALSTLEKANQLAPSIERLCTQSLLQLQSYSTLPYEEYDALYVRSLESYISQNHPLCTSSWVDEA